MDKKEKPVKPEYVRVSPSQRGTWVDCKRKWAFRYIDGIESPTTPKQQFGTDVHTVLENWMKHGTPPPKTPIGETAKLLIRTKWLPPPKTPGAITEGEMHLYPPDMPNVHIYGKVDLMLAYDPWTITDYKTTGDARWFKTAEDLATDGQALMYAAYMATRFRQPIVTARWLYALATTNKRGERTPKRAHPVEHTFYIRSAEFQEQWRIILSDVADIAHAKRTWTDAIKDAPMTVAACENYGGCEHRATCKISGVDNLVAKLEQQDRRNGKNKTLSIIDNSDTKQLTTMENEMSVQDLMSKLRANKTKTKVIEAEAPPVNPILAKLLARETGVNPPEGSPTTALEPTAETVQNTPSGKPKRITCAEKSCKKGVAAKGDRCERHPETVTTAVQGAAEAMKSAADEAVQESTQEGAANKTKNHSSGGWSKGLSGFTVIFDAGYGKGQSEDVRHLGEFMRPVLDYIASENKVEHWAMAGGHFVECRTMLQAKFKAYLDNGAVTPGLVVLADSSTPECGIVKDLLIERADVVIRGMR